MTHTTTTTESVLASLRDRVAQIAPVLESHAADHDAAGTFVRESYDALAGSGLLAAAVPAELGGLGATIGELVELQRELGRHCGSTALASAMHQHVTAFTAWRYRRGLPGAEATLRRIVDDGIVLASTGGGDYSHPAGTAVPVEGGYVVNGRKRFVSQAAASAVVSTMFVLSDPDAGRRVLNVAVPMGSDGVRIDPVWNTLGMRGTGSEDVVFSDVFVPQERVLANRPFGVVDGPLQVISSIAFPIISGAYLGIADAAYEEALEAVAGRPASAIHERQIGLLRHRIQVAGWALQGAVAAVGDDPAPDVDVVLAVMSAKREVAIAAAEVSSIAMELVGGSGFFRGSRVERCYRDARAAQFHPFSPEDTLVEAGRRALGRDGAFPR